jgi:hypothetical protein
MPYKSKKQEAWAHTPAGKKALGEKGVKEFDKASKGKKLPERSKKRRSTSDGSMFTGNNSGKTK